ncbi:cytochrome c oxidase assembly factor Coa1 family protein [Aquimarina longa]|uniref:cytochrome c oxidase assembly factor Coa1 family protein n=1 Tax=Aquimarina longa TaxID=1080221 RepID=UPI0007858261|nr:cytochrome c oxidase assembly factor Coa1 family protein [Aquimarina longa]
MSEILSNKNWWNQNWKWVLPTTGILFCIIIFFMITGNATARYGSILAQPDLTQNAVIIAQKNDQVTEKLGKLSSINFLNLIEGEVQYSNNNSSVAVSVKVAGTKGKASMDIIANKKGEVWEYKKITIRIKKPQKETIKVLE